MKTFHGEKTLKKSLIEFTQNNIESGVYKRGNWLFEEVAKNDLKCGCFYGGMVQSGENPREKASEQYGLPLWYTYVTEKIYEGLPEGNWKQYPLEAIECVPVDVDLNLVRSLFNFRLLENQLQFCKGNIKVTDAIRGCMNLYSKPFNEIEESAAESAAWSAWSARSARSAWSAESAARSAESAARSAESAAWSAESAARSAWSAWSAARSAWSAESAARANYYLWMKDVLIECINEIHFKSHSNKSDVLKELVLIDK